MLVNRIQSGNGWQRKPAEGPNEAVACTGSTAEAASKFSACGVGNPDFTKGFCPPSDLYPCDAL